MDELTPQQNQIILEISKDFYRYAANNLYIKNKDAEIVLFEPNIAQKVLIDRVLELLALGKPIRMIVLKARQMGLSTAIEAIIYWYTSTHQNISAMIVGHEDTSSKNLYNMFKRYYENSNILFKPTRKYDTKTDLTFQREDKDGNQVGLNSVIKTATAKNVSAGRSDTIQLLHGSEIGEWEHGEELVASLLQTVPVRPNTMIFLESTANGRGNFFYKQWQASVKGDTVFEHFFFPWWLHEEYQMEGEIGNYTLEELEIIEIMNEGVEIAGKLYHIDKSTIPDRILFRRYKEREFRATPERLYQEYPSAAHEAFIATGRPVFNIKALSFMEKQCSKHEFGRYDIIQDEERRLTAKPSDDLAPLKVWDMPERGENYVIGADPAEGLAHGDYSVADVVRTRDLKTVARVRGHIDPDLFGHLLDKLGRFYNNALLGVEINNHGLAVVQRLRDLFYTNLYRREKGFDERFEEATSKLGWKTDMRTKPLAIDYLAEAIRDLYIIDYDIVFVEEAFSYVRDDNGRTNAEEGNHDDCFVRGTKIRTKYGEIPIEDVQVGTLVMTREGLKPVVATRSKYKKVIRRLGLVGTPDHPVITTDGDKSLKDMLSRDTIYTWNEKQSCMTERTITDTLIRHGLNSETITGGTIDGRKRLWRSIVSSGLMLTEIFRRDSSSIMPTTTRSTMNCPTSSSSVEPSILTITPTPTGVENGLRATTRTSFRKRLKPSVSGVGKFLKSGVKSGRNIVATSVATITGQRRVYNLQVADKPEYFANNVLVHNCVMAKAIALQTFEWSNNNKADLKVYVPQKMAAFKKKHKVIK